MKIHSRPFIIFILASCFLLLASAQSVFAQNISLGVYPPIIQITATPPTYVQSPFTITNLSGTPVTVHLLVRPFLASEENNGQPSYVHDANWPGPDKKIFSKMSIFDGQQNTDTVILAPNQKRNLELRISLPNNEPPGDYYFSITMLSNPITVGQKSSAAIAGGISTNVLLSIGPQEKTTGTIGQFSSPWFVDKGPVPFTLLVNNTSNHFITPQGAILVKNMFGQTIGKVTLLPVNVLAQSSRYIPDDQKLSDTKAIWPEKFLLGPYSATLIIALSDSGPVYKRTVYFFALPVQVLVGLTLGVILIALITYRVKKQLKNTH